MKWFKHDSTAHTDAKLKRLRAKYGLQGYGLYWYLLELIAKNVDQDNLAFELEEDAELVALETGLHAELVQEMMMFMVNLDLFDNIGGIVSCLKLRRRTDEYTQKLLRATPDKLRTNSGHTPDKVRSIRTEEKRREQNRTEKTKGAPASGKRFAPPTIQQIADYCGEKGYTFDPNQFHAHYQSNGWKVGRNSMKDWRAACRTWQARESDNAQHRRPGRQAIEEIHVGGIEEVCLDQGYDRPG